MSENSSLPVSEVRIARLNVSYLLSGRHPSPAAVRSKFSLLERQLPSACASLLGPLYPESDPSIWFIRRLDVNLAIDASLETAQPAREWSELLARTLQRTLSNSDAREDVLHFPSPAAYLAQFLRDLADGVAWSKWYYAGFNGLRALPMNAALREALCREAAAGEGALLQLAGDGRLERVLCALTEADCRTVLTAFCGTARDAAAPDAITSHLQAAWRASQSTRGLILEPAARHHAALQLYLAMRDGVAAPTRSPALLLAIRALLWLARWMTSLQAVPLLAALQHGDTATAFSLVRGHDIEALSTLLRCKPVLVAEIAEQLRAATTGSTHAISLQAVEPRITPFGGVFWLLPRVDELGLEECAAALPAFEDEPPAALVRFLVLLKCLGAPRTARAFFDPVLREVARVSPDLSAEDVRAWAQGITPERTGDFQTHWVTHCRRQGVISGRWLSVRPARRGRLLLLADGERNIYLRATRSISRLMSVLEEQQAEYCSDAVFCDPALAGMLPATVSGTPVRAWNSSEATACATEEASVATCLERARPPDDDLTYMGLASLFRSARHLDLALSLAARGVLGSFAWRLPGFAWSSADFLYTNFLDVTATVESEAVHWLVRLTRPPLHIVLAMTGAAHDTYRVSWLGGRRVQLTTSES
jgi:hypothetical protein